VFVVAGDVDIDEVLEKAEQAFGGSNYQELTLPEFKVEEGLSGVRRREVEKDVGQAYMGISFLAPNIKSEDVNALDVMSTILGEGRSSRLYQSIREEDQLVTSIDGFYIAQRDGGQIIILATLNADDLDQAEKAILVELAKLRDEGITQEELEKAKTQLITEYAYDTETNLDQAMLLGYYQVAAGNYRLALTYPDEIEKITAEDVKRVASRYLTDDYSIVIVRPEVGT